MTNLRDPGCSCPKLTDRVRAELSGTPLPPACRLHTDDGRTQVEQEKRIEVLEGVLAEQRATTEAQQPPLRLVDVVRHEIANPGSSALNAHPSAYRSLRGYRHSNDPNFDGTSPFTGNDAA